MNLEDLQAAQRAVESNSEARRNERLGEARRQLDHFEGVIGEIRNTLSAHLAPVPLFETLPFTSKLARSSRAFGKPKPPEFTLDTKDPSERRCWLLKTSDLSYNDRPYAATLAISESCELFRVRQMVNVGESFGDELARSGVSASIAGLDRFLLESIEYSPNDKDNSLEQWIPLLANWKPPRFQMDRDQSLRHAIGSFIAAAAAKLPTPRNAFVVGEAIDLTVVNAATSPEMAFVETGTSPSSWLDFVPATPDSAIQSLVKLSIDLEN